MIRVLILLLLFLSSCASLSESGKVDQSGIHYKVGLSFMKEGNYQDAFVQFQKSIQEDPDNKLALNALGLIYLKFEDLERAEQTFLDALDVDNRFSEAYNNLGVVYSKAKKWQKAIHEFENALENPLYPSPERAYTNIGNAYYRLKKYPVAIESYKNALRRSPKFVPARYGLALSYNAVDRYGDAAQAISEGIRDDQEIKGDKRKAADVFNARMVMTIDDEERDDYRHLIEILNY